jgi:uncharacterized protein YebE (UPF0316 family)
MFDLLFSDTPVVVYFIIPALIFLARAVDVSMSTVRIVFLMKGEKFLAALIGFFESLIWLIAIGQIIQNVTNIPAYLGWAGGFALGNYIGLIIEERLAVGKIILRVITQIESATLIEQFKKSGYGITQIHAQGSSGPVKIIFLVINREQIEQAVGIIQEFNPKAFYTIEDVRTAREGVFPPSRAFYSRFNFPDLFRIPKRK